MNNDSVPYAVYESAQARSDRRFKMMWLLVIIMFITLITTNAMWIYYESQFEDEITTDITAEQQADGGGSNYVVNGNYGQTESTNNNN